MLHHSTSIAIDELFARALRACGARKDIGEGKRVHAEISNSNLDKTTYLGNLLIEMYGKCGCLNEAKAVFDDIKTKNVYSWNILLTAYTNNGQLPNARRVFDLMPRKNPVSWTAMLAAYVKYGYLPEALSLFNTMPVQTTPAWNALITGYAAQGDFELSRELFDRMPSKDIVSWNAMITAYCLNGILDGAREIFDQSKERNVITWTAMLTAYAQSGQLSEARELFKEIPDKNLVTWTCMIAGCADAGCELEAILMFKLMDLDGVQPDHMTYVTVVDACAKVGAEADGVAIHEEVVHAGVSGYVVLGTALVTMYGRCKKLEQAEKVFEGMSERNDYSWSAITSAYAQNGEADKAIYMFQRMDLEGIEPNEITLVSVFDACSILPALAYGKLVHSCASEASLCSNVVVVTALINMYGKCGNLELARRVFGSKLCPDDVYVWTAMITAYAQNGLGEEAGHLYRQIHLEGIKPNEVTVLALLSIYSHSGKLEDGLVCFRSLYDYNTPVTMEHYVCMVDLLARLGRLYDAKELINCMPYEPHSVPWIALLSSCRVNHAEHDDPSVCGRGGYAMSKD